MLSGDYTANERRLLYTEVATQIFQELVKHGAQLHRLHFTIRQYEYTDIEADDDEHTWPQYAFEYGAVSAVRDGHRKDIKIISLPSPQDAVKLLHDEDV